MYLFHWLGSRRTDPLLPSALISQLLIIKQPVALGIHVSETMSVQRMHFARIRSVYINETEALNL